MTPMTPTEKNITVSNRHANVSSLITRFVGNICIVSVIVNASSVINTDTLLAKFNGITVSGSLADSVAMDIINNKLHGLYVVTNGSNTDLKIRREVSANGSVMGEIVFAYA